MHLIGGETAEHPGLMPEDDYDLAGFAVGVVDKKDIIDGSDIKPGDVLDRQWRLQVFTAMDFHWFVRYST